MEGCEKYTLKFPQRVLMSFVDSFAFVQQLSPDKNETQVLEDYLVWRWSSHSPNLGPVPTGRGSIAKMRLVLMAQGDSLGVIKCFKELPVEDFQRISEEMAITGCKGQSFSRE